MMCEYYNIDVLIDNMEEYGKYLNKSTKFILFNQNIDLNEILINIGVIKCC